METQNSYKRTVSGSVGAGMGAIFNGSGRTYYMLEHRDSTQYHRSGETQKIIIDQIEIGRDASCQVRFDESCDTVSRKHAAIMRDGDNWKLVHLSQSNPTLVNGQPINGTYYLQSGDEIQLSVGGPRMGFIVPQGKQAMTSSIRLTERMNLFRQQALRPYRRAVWALGILLILAIAGFGAWNYKLGMDNETLRKEVSLYQAQVDSLGLEKARLDELERQITERLAADPENKDLQQQLSSVQQERVRVVYAYNTAGQQLSQARQKAEDYGFDDEEEVKAEPATVAETSSEPQVAESAPAVADASGVSSSDNISNYYNDIYTLKVKKITMERGGNSYDPGIATSNVVVGTGFVVNGTFITARSNIHPWVYNELYPDSWRRELAEWVAAGFKIIIDYEAYSTRGSGHPLRFSSSQFDEEKLSAHDRWITMEIRKDFVKRIKAWGIDFVYKKSTYEQYKAPVWTNGSFDVATIGLGASGSLPVDKATSQSLKGGEEVVIAGFSGRTDIQNLSSYFKYFTSRTSRVSGSYITLQSAENNWGFTGAPAFFKESDGSYRVIGVNVGVFNGEERIVPMYRVN